MLLLVSLKLYYVKTSFFFFIPSVKGVFSLTFFVTEISTKSVHCLNEETTKTCSQRKYCLYQVQNFVEIFLE